MSRSPGLVPPRRPAPSRRRAVLALALGALLLAACSGGGGSTTAESASGGSTSDSGGEVAPQGPGGGAGAGPAAPEEAPTGPAALGRIAPPSTFALVGDLTVEVGDVARAAEQAARLVADAGGRIESDQRGTERLDGKDLVTASLRFRVPPESFQPTVAGLSALGEERRRDLGGEEVGDQIVDVESRLATQRASVARVRALMARAEDLTEIVQVEAELTRRTADLESLESRLAALTARVDLSTITLHLVSEDVPEPVAGPPGFRDGLRAGWDALVSVGRTLGLTAGAVLPFSPLLLLVGYAGWRARTRRTHGFSATAEATPH